MRNSEKNEQKSKNQNAISVILLYNRAIDLMLLAKGGEMMILGTKMHSIDPQTFQYLASCFQGYSCKVFMLLQADTAGAYTGCECFLPPERALAVVLPLSHSSGFIHDSVMVAEEPNTAYPVYDGVLRYRYQVGNSFYLLIMETNFLREILCDTNYIRNTSVKHFPVREKLLHLIQMFREEFERTSFEHEAVLQSIAHLLCTELVRQATHISKPLSGRSFSKKHTEVLAAAEYILVHCGEPLSIEKLSQKFHMSKYYFSHIFKQEIGESPYSYLTRARIAQAKRMLIYESTSIMEISHRCGFSTPNHFSDLFRQKTGVSPNEYRAQHAKGML